VACSSNCPTQDHASYGACLRSKSLQVADVTAHKFNQSQHSQIKAYVNARESGLQPASVFKKDVDAAWKATEKTGTPFRADR
jgi:hypothetical protein